MTIRPRAAFCTLGVVTVLLSQPAVASSVPEGPRNMTVPQFQGLSCLGGGALGGLVAYTFTDTLVLSGTVAVSPLVIVGPAVVTGFAIGCSIAANAAPGLFWLSTKLP